MASELQRLTRAVAFAAEAHRNHRRKGASQEPYINHLIEVADLVASVEDGDVDVLIAASIEGAGLETGRPGRTASSCKPKNAYPVAQITDRNPDSRMWRRRIGAPMQGGSGT